MQSQARPDQEGSFSFPYKITSGGIPRLPGEILTKIIRYGLLNRTESNRIHIWANPDSTNPDGKISCASCFHNDKVEQRRIHGVAKHPHEYSDTNTECTNWLWRSDGKEVLLKPQFQSFLWISRFVYVLYMTPLPRRKV